MKTKLFFLIVFITTGVVAQPSGIHPMTRECNRTASEGGPLSTQVFGGETNTRNEVRRYKEAYSSVGKRPLDKTSPSHGLDYFIALFDSIYTWGWDSGNDNWMSSPDTREVDIIYDARNNLLTYTEQIWNGTGWNNSGRWVFVYDSNNNLLCETHQNSINGFWLDDYRWIYTYDTNNNMLSEGYESWDGTRWNHSNRYLYTYDSHNNKLSSTTLYWNVSQWENSYRTLFVYDSLDHLLSESHQDWNNTVWENNAMAVYDYDTNHRMMSKTYNTWDGILWSEISKELYYYDANGWRSLVEYQSWTGSFWYSSGRISFAYDSSGNMLNETHQTFDGFQWNYSMKLIFSYDSRSNQLSEHYQIYENGNWKSIHLLEYAYDVNDLRTDYVYKHFDSTGTTVEMGDSSHYYFHTVIGVDELVIHSTNFLLYPNPATGSSEIHLKSEAGLFSPVEMVIRDLMGSLIRVETIYPEATWFNIGDLPSGVYLISVCSKAGTENHRLVVHRSE